MRMRFFVDTKSLTKRELSRLSRMSPHERRTFFLEQASQITLDDEALLRIEKAWRKV
jgi:hypothetical protein